MKNRLQLIRAKPTFHYISENPSVSLGIVECSLHTCRTTLKNNYHKRRVDMFVFSPVEFNYLDTLAKNFIIPLAKTSSFNETRLTILQLFGFLFH